MRIKQWETWFPKRLLLLVIFFASCHPVKRVLQDPIKFETVAREVVKRGYCLNDTTRRDTTFILQVKDSLVVDTFLLPAQQPIPLLEIDTVFASGARVVINDQGLLSINCPVKVVEKQVAVNHFIRDKKLEQILQQDIDQRDRTINQLNSTRFALQEKIAQKEEQVSSLKQRIRARTLQLVGVLVLAAVYLGFKLFRRISPIL